MNTTRDTRPRWSRREIELGRYWRRNEIARDLAAILRPRPQTAADLAAFLRQPIGTIRAHLRQLRRFGLIRQAGKTHTGATLWERD